MEVPSVLLSKIVHPRNLIPRTQIEMPTDPSLRINFVRLLMLVSQTACHVLAA